MWKIGNVEINSKVVLGPMAGITSVSYRKFMKPFGVGLVVSEMVSDCGLIYENQKTLRYLDTDESEHPVAIQLFGGEISEMVEAISIIENSGSNYDILDINLGCPVSKVLKQKAGSALLKDVDYLKEYMTAIVSASHKPVTAKIRLGFDDEHINFMEVIKVLEEAKVSAIAIHARTTKQMYAGKANYEILRDLQSKINVPLIVSGDIFTLEDAINAVNITGATAVMVARGGVGNPGLIKQIDTYFRTGEKIINFSKEENTKLFIQYMDLLIEEKGEASAIRILRGIAPKFFIFPGSKALKNELCQTINSREDVLKLLSNYKLI